MTVARGTRSWAPAPRLGVVAGVVVLGSIMTVVDVTIANVALDPLAADLDSTLPRAQWVTSGYTLALAAVMPASRWAMDRIGTRSVYLGSLVLFTLASALAMTAGDIEWLIAFRVLQGIGGGMLAPTGMTMVIRAAGPARLGLATRILGLPLLAAPLLGPVLGGLLIDAVSWRAMFAINVPIGITAVALAAAMLPRDRPTDTSRHRLDVAALLMLSPGVALLVLGLTRSADHGADLTTVLVPALGVALLAGFVARTWSSSHPMLDIRLLRRRSVGPAIAVSCVFACGYFGSLFLAPLYFQLVDGASVSVSGVLVAPMGVCAAVSMQISGMLGDRLGAARVVRAGVACALTGIGTFALQLHPGASPAGLCVSLAVLGLGVGATLMPTIAVANAGLASEEVPSVSTIFQVAGQLASAVGTALVAITLSGALSASLGVPPPGDGLAAARSMSAPALQASAAVADGFRSAYLVGAGFFALALLISLTLESRSATARRVQGQR